jgi:hypothetical protein
LVAAVLSICSAVDLDHHQLPSVVDPVSVPSVRPQLASFDFCIIESVLQSAFYRLSCQMTRRSIAVV